jgi:hypothetical protein
MKLSQLKLIVKEAVKEAIQEEMKDILLEAVRVPKANIQETVVQKPLPKADKAQLRENMMNVLGGMMPGADGTLKANSSNIPLQVTTTDTTSPNGKLPDGEVSMDQIMGLMQVK